MGNFPPGSPFPSSLRLQEWNLYPEKVFGGNYALGSPSPSSPGLWGWNSCTWEGLLGKIWDIFSPWIPTSILTEAPGMELFPSGRNFGDNYPPGIPISILTGTPGAESFPQSGIWGKFGILQHFSIPPSTPLPTTALTPGILPEFPGITQGSPPPQQGSKTSLLSHSCPSRTGFSPPSTQNPLEGTRWGDFGDVLSPFQKRKKKKSVDFCSWSCKYVRFQRIFITSMEFQEYPSERRLGGHSLMIPGRNFCIFLIQGCPIPTGKGVPWFSCQSRCVPRGLIPWREK